MRIKNLIYFFAALMAMSLTSCKKTSDNRTLKAPTVTTGTATNIAGPMATVSGSVTDDGGSIVTAAGVCYDTIVGVTIAKNKVTSPHTVSGGYSVNLTGLTMGKTYYFKAFATNSKGTSYGNEQSFYAPISINGYTASSQIATSNLKGYFAFDNSLADSVSGTSATAHGTTYANGVKGKALQVGLNNYAVFTPTAAIKSLQSMTVAFWVNTSQNSAGIQTPICFANATQFWANFEMFFDGQTSSSSVLKIHAFGNGGASEGWLTAWSLTNPWNSWIHLALTYDASSATFSFYKNGALVGSSVQSGFGPLNFANFPAIVFGTAQFQTTPSLTLATTSQPWASFILGAIDQVRIYNKALSLSELQALSGLEGSGL